MVCCPCQHLGYKFSHPDGGNYMIIGIRKEYDDYILEIVRQDKLVENPRGEILWSRFTEVVKNVW